jgi:hypothetical protein
MVLGNIHTTKFCYDSCSDVAATLHLDLSGDYGAAEHNQICQTLSREF